MAKKESQDVPAILREDDEKKSGVYVTGWEAQLRQIESVEQDASYATFYYGKKHGTQMKEEEKAGQ